MSTNRPSDLIWLFNATRFDGVTVDVEGVQNQTVGGKQRNKQYKQRNVEVYRSATSQWKDRKPITSKPCDVQTNRLKKLKNRHYVKLARVGWHKENCLIRLFILCMFGQWSASFVYRISTFNKTRQPWRLSWSIAITCCKNLVNNLREVQT